MAAIDLVAHLRRKGTPRGSGLRRLAQWCSGDFFRTVSLEHGSQWELHIGWHRRRADGAGFREWHSVHLSGADPVALVRDAFVAIADDESGEGDRPSPEDAVTEALLAAKPARRRRRHAR